jgi:hypothetical protein
MENVCKKIFGNAAYVFYVKLNPPFDITDNYIECFQKYDKV